jgi:cell division protein FtsL
MAMPARALPVPRVRYVRTARTATQRRISHNRRNRYGTMRRMVLCISVVMAVLLADVLMTATITAHSYTLDRANAERTALLMKTERLDDEIATLTSDDRLAVVAGKLGMIQPQGFLRLSLRKEQAQGPIPLAFLSH